MKKFIFGLIGIMFVSVMVLSLSSCSKEEVEPEKEEVEQGKEEVEPGKEEVEPGKDEEEPGKDEDEPGKDEDEVSILGTWRCYTDEAKGYYYQITLEEDGTLIWREIDDHENETINKNSTYTYKDGCITWYWENSVEAIWYVSLLYKTEMITYRVDKHTGEIDEEEKDIWVKIK